MKNVRKLLGTLLAIVLVFGMVAVPVQAYDTGTVKGNGYQTVSAGQYHAAAVDKDNNLWIWGWNGFGQIGNGGGDGPSSPFILMKDVASVSCGTLCTAVIKTDGSLWMWGDNSSGQIGNGTKETAAKPVKIMDNVASVSCGEDSVNVRFATAAVKTDGSLWVWGDTSCGTLANGSYGANLESLTPQKVMDDVSMAGCGGSFIVAAKTDGTLWAWGATNNGVLGADVHDAEIPGHGVQTTPIKVMDNVTAVSCGSDMVAAIKADGSLWTWGFNSKGQLGRGDRGGWSSAPTKIMDGVASISTGADHMVAVKADGSLWTWGSHEYGQLGNGDAVTEKGTYNPTPSKIAGNMTFAVTGFKCTFAIATDGTLSACGQNRKDKLGFSGGDVSFTEMGSSSLYGQTRLREVPGFKVKTAASATITPQPPVNNPTKFSDVKSTDYFADAVTWAVENKVTSGTSATTFSPNASCTRAQAVTFIWRALGCPEPQVRTAGFEDVPADAYYAKAVQWAAESGVTSGTSATTFSPDQVCNRAQIVTFLWRAADAPEAESSGKFTDVESSAYYADAVDWAVAQNITSGTSATTFSPGSNCTRAQIVTFLYRDLAD